MNNETCDHKSLTFWRLVDALNYAEYYAVLPIFAFVGVFGRSVTLAAFSKQSIKEKAYVYQILVAISELLEAITFTIFLVSFLGGGANGGWKGFDWYLGNYALMFYAAHVAIPIIRGFSNTTLLLSVCMSLDRVFAVLKPFSYKNIDHRRAQMLAAILSTFFGFATTWYGTYQFEMRLDEKSGSYEIGIDKSWSSSWTSFGLDIVSNLTRVGGLLALIICNAIIIRKYRQRLNQVVQMTTGTGSHQSAESENLKKKKLAEKSLLFLTISQSLFTSVSMISYVCYCTMAYLMPKFICENTLYGPLLNVTLMVSGILDTITVVVMNKKSREMMTNMSRWLLAGCAATAATRN